MSHLFRCNLEFKRRMIQYFFQRDYEKELDFVKDVLFLLLLYPS